MNLEVLTTQAQHLAALRRLCRESMEIKLCHAWVESRKGTAAHWRHLDLEKVTRAAVGISFSHSEPWALRHLHAGGKRLRLMLETKGTFHPKITLGKSQNRVIAIVGSANFTTAAHDKNDECSLLMEGKPDDARLMALEAYIEHCWKQGTSVKDDWFDTYEIAWNARPKADQFRIQSDKVVELDSAEMSWQAFLGWVATQHGRRLKNGSTIQIQGPRSYLSELDACTIALSRAGSFSGLALAERRRVAGLSPESTGYLGRMDRARDFAAMVTARPSPLSPILDAVPRRGSISLAQARGFVERLIQLDGVGLGAATRLLTVLRPDTFVSLNFASRKGAARMLEDNAVTTANGYIELLGAVWASSWRNSPAPGNGFAKRVWKYRTAMLDAMLYDP